MLSDKKLNEESFAGKNIQSLPNTPSTAGITTQQLKAAFDRVGEKIIAVAVNGMIDDLVGVEGGANIGVTGGGTVQEHLDSRFNPHNVTKGQVGLGEVTNTADMDKPVSTLQAAAIALKCDVAYVDEQDAATYDAAKEYADSLAFTSGLVTSVFGKAGNITLLDCGDWEQSEIERHDGDVFSHQNIVVDGSLTAVSSTDIEFEQHKRNTTAHENVIINGGAFDG